MCTFERDFENPVSNIILNKIYDIIDFNFGCKLYIQFTTFSTYAFPNAVLSYADGNETSD